MPKVGNREEKPRKSRRYPTAESMQKKIDEYFKNPHRKTILFKGEEVEVEIVTLEYIAINHLGFKTKQSLFDYRNRYPGEGYGEVLDSMTDQAISWWITFGSLSSAPMCTTMLERLSRRREQIAVKKDATPVETAGSIIEAALKNDISLETMQKLMQAVKQKADIEKQVEAPDEEAPTLNISFEVAEPVSDISVTRGE